MLACYTSYRISCLEDIDSLARIVRSSSMTPRAGCTSTREDSYDQALCYSSSHDTCGVEDKHRDLPQHDLRGREHMIFSDSTEGWKSCFFQVGVEVRV